MNQKIGDCLVILPCICNQLILFTDVYCSKMFFRECPSQIPFITNYPQSLRLKGIGTVILLVHGSVGQLGFKSAPLLQAAGPKLSLGSGLLASA